MTLISLKESTMDFVNTNRAYYEQWVFDKPMVVSQHQHQSMIDLQGLMYKLITHFVNAYDSYKELMPISERAHQIVKTFSQRLYNPGTYRTDFVFDEANQIKIIEITCRFSLNTIFDNAIFYSVGQDYAVKNLNGLVFDQCYEGVFPYLEQYVRYSDEVVILKGSDLRNASRIFSGILENTGKKVREIRFNELSQYKGILAKAWIISELTLDELEQLDDDVLHLLANSNIINDLRTVLLIHDKRFFGVLGDEGFLNDALNPDEVQKFKQFYIPTFTIDQARDEWTSARKNKDEWILKHRALGKSKSIYAGIVTDQEEWENLFDSPGISEFVLQRWVPQRTFKGDLDGKIYDDYITGTLLFFDNHYFGLGPFRTSSFPVTNVVDDRKVAGLALIEGSKADLANHLFYFVD